MPTYARTYARNHVGTEVVTSDIRKLNADDIRTRLGIEKGSLDLIVGGLLAKGFPLMPLLVAQKIKETICLKNI